MKILIPILGIAAIVGASWWYMNNKDSLYNRGESVDYEEGWELPEKKSVNQEKEYEDRTSVVDPTNILEPQIDTDNTDSVTEPADNDGEGDNASSSEDTAVDDVEANVPSNPIQVGEVVVGGDAVVPETEADKVSVTVLGGNYYYDIKEIKVKEGDEVTINFRAVEGFHDWVVDEFGAATDKVKPGADTRVTFIADKKGTFEYYCSVGSHRANGMVGQLIVE